MAKAARDMAKSEPEFAIEADIAALKWLVAGYGYKITGADGMRQRNRVGTLAENKAAAQSRGPA